MTPTQWKLALAGLGALLAWWFTTKSSGTAAAPGKVTTTLDIDANVNSSTFGQTIHDIEQAQADKANPAVDPEMRKLIDKSNALLAADDLETP